MNSKELIDTLSKILSNRQDSHDIATFIVSSILDCGRLDIVDNVRKCDIRRAISYAKKVCRGIPSQYVLGFADFYKYRFFVNKYVLIPRFDTEILVEQSLKYITKGSNVCDMCTGSGACGITISLEANCKCDLVDISKKALKVANKNAKLLGAKCRIIKSNLFDNIDNVYDVIVSNPPYIKTADYKNLDELVLHEPRLALDGGADGLIYYRNIAKESVHHLSQNGVILVEIGQGQSEDVKNIFSKYYKNIKVVKDYNGIDRVVIATNGEIL